MSNKKKMKYLTIDEIRRRWQLKFGVVYTDEEIIKILGEPDLDLPVGSADKLKS